jgi:hypothetical protein
LNVLKGTPESIHFGPQVLKPLNKIGRLPGQNREIKPKILMVIRQNLLSIFCPDETHRRTFFILLPWTWQEIYSHCEELVRRDEQVLSESHLREAAWDQSEKFKKIREKFKQNPTKLNFISHLDYAHQGRFHLQYSFRENGNGMG